MKQESRDPLQRFINAHNIPHDAVLELEAELKSRQKRRTIVVVISLLVVILVGSIFVHRVSSKTPEVLSKITNEKWQSVEEIVKVRISEAYNLSNRLFDFTRRLFQTSIPAAELRAHWKSGHASLQSLSADLSDLPKAPIDASKRLIKTGPSRIHSIISHVGSAAEILRQWIPTLFGALSELKAGDDKMKQVLNILNARLQPFINETELSKEWFDLHSDILDWLTRVQIDIDVIKKSTTGEEMSSEFTRRLGKAVLGLP